eukprot:gene13121-8967_t
MLSSANYKANESNWQHYPESNQANKASMLPLKQRNRGPTQTIHTTHKSNSDNQFTTTKSNHNIHESKGGKSKITCKSYTTSKSSQPKTQSHVQSTNHNEHTVVLTKHTNIQSIHGNKQTSTTKGNNNLHHKVT